MQDKYKVYKHTFPNNKVYIGITKLPLERRWRNNGKGYRTQPLIWKAINKYGWNNIEHETLFDNLSFEEAKQKEIELIKKYKSNDISFGYNRTEGGEGVMGYVCSDETRQKLSKVWKGRHHTEETKRIMSEKAKGHKVSEKSLMKLKETMIKLVASGKLKKPHNVSPEGRLTLRKNTSSAIVQYDANKNAIALWESGSLVIEVLKINPYNATKKPNLKAGGFYWKKCEDVSKEERMYMVFKRLNIYTYENKKGVEVNVLF